MADHSTCPLCRFDLEVKSDLIRLPFSFAEVKDKKGNSDNYESAKILKIIQELDKNLKNNEKTVIFSHFLNMIDYLSDKMKKLKVNFNVITGSTPQKNRQKIVTDFQENKNVKVIIISIKAGGVGLNLTSANNVFICEPWWNIAIEDQAVDRVHRIGQKK